MDSNHGRVKRKREAPKRWEDDMPQGALCPQPLETFQTPLLLRRHEHDVELCRSTEE